MPSTFASRAVLRQSRLLLRQHQFRQASTAAETATKAKEATSTTVSKASEGLSRVSSSAGSTLSKAGASARSVLGRVGGRTGRLIAFVESLIPPTVYYGRVGLELGKIAFQGQKMSPPSVAQFQAYLEPITKTLSNPRTIFSSTNALASGVNPQAVLSSIRNITGQQIVTVGVIGAEVLGFFTVGTMIGRLKIVGYHGSVHHDH